MKETVSNINDGNTLSHRIEVLIRAFVSSEIINYAVEMLAESRMCNYGEEAKYFQSLVFSKGKSGKIALSFEEERGNMEKKKDEMNFSQSFSKSVESHPLHEHIKNVDT